jgi:hypothetical protein
MASLVYFQAVDITETSLTSHVFVDRCAFHASTGTAQPGPVCRDPSDLGMQCPDWDNDAGGAPAARVRRGLYAAGRKAEPGRGKEASFLGK